MYLKEQRRWIFVLSLAVNLQPAAVQIPLYPMPPPMLAMPPPPILVPVSMIQAVPIEIKLSEITTTTTPTTEAVAVAIPIPVPVPSVQFAIPAYPPPNFCQTKIRPKNCPPCPPCLCSPSCTPAFFSYSQCHLKCRCRNSDDTPIPIPAAPPIPVPGPSYAVGVPPPMLIPQASPVVVVPFPPNPPIHSDTTDDSSDSESSSDESFRRKRRKGKAKRRRFRISRRNFGNIDTDFIKPVLTYVSKNGEVKIKKRISRDDAAQLLNENFNRPQTMLGEKFNRPQNVRVAAENDANGHSRLILSSDNTQLNGRKSQTLLKEGISEQMLEEGKKELIFRPPGNKQISNLSVSFQIT